jgi:hypothetical protein
MQIGGQDTTFGGMRNRIINGNMVISQRGTSFTAPNPAYTTDRWNCICYNSTATITQSSTAPAGFVNSWLQTIGTGSSSSTGNWEGVGQNIEAINVGDLGWGTADAKPITISFWVRSSVTGIYNTSVSNLAVQSLSSTSSYHYISTYTINSANTWEQKTITVPGPTSGSWNISGTSLGLSLWFDLGSGTNYNSSNPNTWENGTYFRTSSATSQVSSVTGSTWYVTGVQLEKGSVASAFEQLHYGHILALCYRYNYVWYRRGASSDSNLALPGVGSFYSTTTCYTNIQFPVTMRTTPSLTTPNRTDAYGFPSNNNSYYAPTVVLGHQFYNGCFIMGTTTSSATAGHAANSYMATSNWVSGDYLGFSAEL